MWNGTNSNCFLAFFSPHSFVRSFFFSISLQLSQSHDDEAFYFYFFFPSLRSFLVLATTVVMLMLLFPLYSKCRTNERVVACVVRCLTLKLLSIYFWIKDQQKAFLWNLFIEGARVCRVYGYNGQNNTKRSSFSYQLDDKREEGWRDCVYVHFTNISPH